MARRRKSLRRQNVRSTIAPLVRDGIEGIGPLAVLPIGDDDAAAAFGQPVAQLVAVVGGIGDHAQIARKPGQHRAGWNTIVALPASQADDLGTAMGIGDQMDFGVAATAARPDRARIPLFRRPVLAER